MLIYSKSSENFARGHSSSSKHMLNRVANTETHCFSSLGLKELPNKNLLDFAKKIKFVASNIFNTNCVRVSL